MNWIDGIAQGDIGELHAPLTLVLALVAAVGYLLGLRARRGGIRQSLAQARDDIERTRLVAQELEWIAAKVRKSLAKHHTSLTRFQKQFRELDAQQDSPSWSELCSEADEVLGPTLQLAEDISQAYDLIRQQSHQLMSFGVSRTDHRSGVCNRTALDDALQSMFAMQHQYGLQFSIVMFDVSDDESEAAHEAKPVNDRSLRRVAQSIAGELRKCDILVRDAGQQFVIVMPGEELDDAIGVASRLSQKIMRQYKWKVQGGVAAAQAGDTPVELLRRVREALRDAQSSWDHNFSLHTGVQVAPLPIVRSSSDKTLASANNR